MPTVVNNVSNPRGAVQGLTFFWDVDTLTWVPGQQPTLEADSVTVTGGFLTDTQLRATNLTVDQGTGADISGAWKVVDSSPTSIEGGKLVHVANITPVPVDGSSVTQPVSGPLTNTQLRATPVPISGTITASGPLTDTQLRASDVKITLDGEVVPVTGTFYQATQPVSIASAPVTPVTDNGGSLTVDGTFFQATQPVSIASAVPITDNSGSLTVDGSVTVTQATGSNLHSVIDSGTITTVSTVTGITNVVHVDDNSSTLSIDDGAGSITVDGAVTVSGSLTTVSTVSTITNVVHIDDNAGNISIDDGGNSITVDGTFFQATQPISATSLPLPTLAATSTKQSDGTQKTQVVDGSGNVIGSTSNAIDINIKSGNPTTITATQGTGTNLHTVVDSGTITAVTAITNALPAGSNVIGHVIHDTGSTTVVTGNVTVVQPTGTSLHAVLDTTSTTAVTQATGTNLHTVVDSGTITTVSAVTAITNALPAGSALIGKVGIDQTTPGTTNKVSLGSDVVHTIVDSGSTVVTQGTGTNLHTVVDSGTITTVSAVTGITNPVHVIADSGTVSTITNVVHVDDNSGSLTVDNAGTFAVQATLQAGSAIAGKVGIDQTTPGTTNKVSLGSDIVNISGSISASTSADVLAADTDAGYIAAQTGKNLVQTPDGRLRVIVAGKVSDARESYVDNDVRSLSITTDGRLRVATSESAMYIEMFQDHANPFFNIPDQLKSSISSPNNPWNF